MSVLAPPPVVPSNDQDVKALIREARARRRRRMLLIAAGLAAAAGVGVAIWAVLSGGGTAAARISGRDAGSVDRRSAA